MLYWLRSSRTKPIKQNTQIHKHYHTPHTELCILIPGTILVEYRPLFSSAATRLRKTLGVQHQPVHRPAAKRRRHWSAESREPSRIRSCPPPEIGERQLESAKNRQRDWERKLLPYRMREIRAGVFMWASFRVEFVCWTHVYFRVVACGHKKTKRMRGRNLGL